MTETRTIKISTRQGDADITIPAGFMHRSELLAQGWDDTLLTAFVPSRFTLLDGYPELGRTDRMIWPTNEVDAARMVWAEIIEPIRAHNLAPKDGFEITAEVLEIDRLHVGLRERAAVRRAEHDRIAANEEGAASFMDELNTQLSSRRLQEEFDAVRLKKAELKVASAPLKKGPHAESGWYCEDCQDGGCLQHEEGPVVMELGFHGEQFA